MRLLLLWLLMLCTTVCFSQKALEAIETLYTKFPQEKVILSLSKNEYLAGETIFFKAYVLTGYELSEISTNLYTELYDQNKQLIDKRIIPLFKGTGDGSFILPSSLAENVYYIRAYTRYMLNFNESFQLIKPVNIYNPASMNKLVPQPAQWTAAAYVEGGTLLSETPGAVAIHLSSNGSLPERWEGQLLEKETRTLVSDVSVLNKETGIVRFIPSANTRYVISIKDALGHTQTMDVPRAVDSGTSLQLWVRNNKLEYVIQTRNVASKGVGYTVIGTMHEQVMFTAAIKKSDGDIRGVVDLTGIPSGVLQVTLFNEAEQPVNQRLCFVHQHLKPVTPAISTDTLSFSKKGLNHWQMEIDSLSWPSYAVQISDADYPIANNFLSDLYLSSDFDHSIHQASWYFHDVDDQKKAALDALLISQKWTRFNWNDLVQKRFPSIKYHPEKYLSYTATVRKGKKLQPWRDVNLIFRGKDSSMQIVQVKTDSTGSFKMENVIFIDTMRVYHQANSRKFFERDLDISFELQNKFIPYTKNFPPSAYQVTKRKENDPPPPHIQWTATQKANEILLNEKEKVMQEVVISTTKKNATQELDNKLSTGMFSTVDAMIFDFVNEEQTSALSYTNILEWLEGRVPGYGTTRVDGGLIPMLRGAPTQIYLDEMPVEPEMLNGFPVTNIAMVKVIRGIFLGGRGGNGAIAIYTRRGGMRSNITTPSLPINLITGYQSPARFTSPDYSQVRQDVADQREVLYYQTMPYPNDTTLKAVIRFYNNDQAKKYRVIVTGFASNGQPVFLNKLISR